MYNPVTMISSSLFISIGLCLSAMAQTCLDGIPAGSTPTERFSVHNNGTVTDTRTNLMWKVCSEGQTWQAGSCTGTVAGLFWDAALDRAVTHVFAGEEGWRLPNVKELSSIVELQCESPAINTAVFPETQGEWFWSSSPYVPNGNGSSSLAPSRNEAWMVNFIEGSILTSIKIFPNHVRLVRNRE